MKFERLFFGPGENNSHYLSLFSPCLEKELHNDRVLGLEWV